MSASLDVVVLGLSITSSWGNGHATGFRALAKAFERRGHRLLFLERDVPWYAARRDLEQVPGGELGLYDGLEEARARFGERVREADLVVLGSFVPEGRAVAEWVLAETRGVSAFYDVDTPRTLAQLRAGTCEYLAPEQVPRFDLYLSFSGGAVLETLRREHGARRPRAFYCCVDPELHRPAGVEPDLELGYLGTYSDDRQPTLLRLLIEPARQRPLARFAVAGPCYPPELDWPANVERIEHLAPPDHARFYGRQRWTLNVTRRDMVLAGWSPSVRLFEAAACGVPVVSDDWPGLGELFVLGEELLVARGPRDVLALLDGWSEERRRAVAGRARARVLAEHTADHRVLELEEQLARTPRRGARARAGVPPIGGQR